MQSAIRRTGNFISQKIYRNWCKNTHNKWTDEYCCCDRCAALLCIATDGWCLIRARIITANETTQNDGINYLSNVVEYVRMKLTTYAHTPFRFESDKQLIPNRQTSMMSCIYTGTHAIAHQNILVARCDVRCFRFRFTLLFLSCWASSFIHLLSSASRHQSGGHWLSGEPIIVFSATFQLLNNVLSLSFPSHWHHSLQAKPTTTTSCSAAGFSLVVNANVIICEYFC